MNDIKLSNLQAVIMQVLWDRKEATSSEVQEALKGNRDLAKTTVSTVLSRLKDKGIVDYRTEGRAFVYFPAVSQDEVRRSMVANLTEKLFQGQSSELLTHLLRESEIDPEELDRLKRIVENKETGDDNE